MVGSDCVEVDILKHLQFLFDFETRLVRCYDGYYDIDDFLKLECVFGYGNYIIEIYIIDGLVVIRLTFPSDYYTSKHVYREFDLSSPDCFDKVVECAEDEHNRFYYCVNEGVYYMDRYDDY